MASCMDCKIEYETVNGNRLGIIRFCPLHAVAPELLRAAQLAYRLAAWDTHHLFDSDTTKALAESIAKAGR